MKITKEKSIVAFSLAFFLWIIVKDAWLSDDAYITYDYLLRNYSHELQIHNKR